MGYKEICSLSYTFIATKTFEKNLKKNVKDSSLRKKVLKKMDKICQNPLLGKPLRNVLVNKRRERVNSFVIIYEIKDRQVIFHTVKHHDYIYQ